MDTVAYGYPQNQIITLYTWYLIFFRIHPPSFELYVINWQPLGRLKILLFCISWNAHLFGHVGTGDTHSDTDIGLLEGGRVVDSVSRHRHDGSESLATLYDDQLLLWGRAGKHDFRVEPDFKNNICIDIIIQPATCRYDLNRVSGSEWMDG